jgi:hypothetical protein
VGGGGYTCSTGRLARVAAGHLPEQLCVLHAGHTVCTPQAKPGVKLHLVTETVDGHDLDLLQVFVCCDAGRCGAVRTVHAACCDVDGSTCAGAVLGCLVTNASAIFACLAPLCARVCVSRCAARGRGACR